MFGSESAPASPRARLLRLLCLRQRLWAEAVSMATNSSVPTWPRRSERGRGTHTPSVLPGTNVVALEPEDPAFSKEAMPHAGPKAPLSRGVVDRDIYFAPKTDLEDLL